MAVSLYASAVRLFSDDPGTLWGKEEEEEGRKAKSVPFGTNFALERVRLASFIFNCKWR